MKIQKGHYVPKELITSEAVHEAVVKCFVAAGFEAKSKWCSPNASNKGIGLAVDYDGLIAWMSVSKEPLTLQQLFTAENGLQWPENAYRVVASGTGVWFDLSRLPPVVISGVYSGGTDARVLAIRQPNALTQAQSLTHSEEGLTHSEWWDYENGCIIDEQCPPIGSIVDLRESTEFLSLASGEITIISAGAHCHVVGHAERPDNNFKCVTLMSVINLEAGFCTGNPTRLVRPLDHATRKAELDRKKFIDAAAKLIIDDKNSFIAEYEYWLDNKKPSGDCDELHCKWLSSRDYAECVDNLRFYLGLAYDKGFIHFAEQPK